MKIIRVLALLFLALSFLASLAAGWIAPDAFDLQHRNAILVGPCREFLLGTDDLGRDLFSRMLYGSRISLLLAPAAAVVATFIALAVGSAASLLGGPAKLFLHRVVDLFLSVPWLFLLLIVRAMLPLNMSPVLSVLATFLVLGAFGWAASARVLSESVAAICASDYVAQSRSQGIGPCRRLTRHVLPNLRPVILAQFWICVPVFIVGEANLGLLGLGVGEPFPSWGNLLRQLENIDRVMSHPWLIAPLCLILLVLASIQLSFSARPTHS